MACATNDRTAAVYSVTKLELTTAVSESDTAEKSEYYTFTCSGSKDNVNVPSFFCCVLDIFYTSFASICIRY